MRETRGSMTDLNSQRYLVSELGKKWVFHLKSLIVNANYHGKRENSKQYGTFNILD